jgi:hypothetical protein
MNLYDIDSLSRDANQDNLYNLFTPTFNTVEGYALDSYLVSQEEEMRLDLISNVVYKSVDYVDLVCNVNDIDNPLNVMMDDFLLIPPMGNVNIYRSKEPDVVETRNILLNSNKTSRIDNNRKQYVEQNYSLPPTFQEVPTQPVKIDNGQIVIGG